MKAEGTANIISQILGHVSQKKVPENKKFGFYQCLKMNPGRIILELKKTDRGEKKNFLLLYLLKDLIESIGKKRYTDLINIILIETQKPIEERNPIVVIAAYESL